MNLKDEQICFKTPETMTNDPYTVEFWAKRTGKKVFEGVYNDTLKQIFETETGLRVSL